MCPGCPTFSIPVPIPKAILGAVGAAGAGAAGGKVDYQHARNRTFLEKIGDRIVNGFQKVQNTVTDFVIDPILETGESFLGIEDDENSLQEKIDSPHHKNSVSETSKGYSTFAIAALGAMAIGGVVFLESSILASQFINKDRSISRSMKGEDSFRTLQKSIKKYQE